MDIGYVALKKYDVELSKNWRIPCSIKITSVKPSGTVSLLAGVTPGVHYPVSTYYLRRVRLSKTSPLLEELEKSGLEIEPDVVDVSSVVVAFPICFEEPDMRASRDVSMWEQLELAAFMQTYWADNQVSVTVEFHPSEAADIPRALNFYQFRLKGVSFLPRMELATTKYKQLPYEPITAGEYLKRVQTVKPLKLNKSRNEILDRFCDNDSCTF
jgi:hypothetical protein